MKIDSYGVGPVQNHRNEPAPPPAVVHAQRGDRMADVAQRYGVDEGALRQANPQLGDQLLAGQTLNLPARSDANLPSSTQQSAQAAAAAVGAQNLREPVNIDHQQRALEGFRAADGLRPGEAAPPGSHTDLAQRAFDRAAKAATTQELTPDQATQMKQALLRVGAGLRDGGIEPHVNGALKSQLRDLAEASPRLDAREKTGNFTGSLAQLSRTGQAAMRPDLMPGTKVVNDAGAGQQLRGSGLPDIDPMKHGALDADVYYKTRDGVLHVESSKHNASTLANGIDDHLKAGKVDTQIARQQDWRAAGTPAEPRSLGYFVLEKKHENLQALLNGKNVDVLSQAIGDDGARRIVIGERAYSVNDLREMGRLAVEKATTTTTDFKDFNKQWADTHNGKKPAPAEFYKANFDTPDKLMSYVGKQYGEPVRETAALRTQPQQFQTARQGAATGAAIGGAVSLIRLAADGKLSIEAAGQVAKDSAVGALTGAATARGERLLAPAVDRAIGNAVERGASSAARSTGMHSMQAAERGLLARGLVTRAAGSTIVGTAISTGISVYENRHGLAKGDSKAIGNVAADTVVGAGAVLGGMAAGAAVGSVVPVVGTAIGAVVGGAVVAWGAHASGARDAIANGASKAADWVKSWF